MESHAVARLTPPRLTTLGDVRLHVGAGEPLAGRRKPLALLAFLAMRAPRAVDREELAALLWGERDERRARHSLRTELSRISHALPDVLEVGTRTVGLRDGALELDAAAFERDVLAGRLEDAIARWGGDLLAGADDLGGERYRTWLEGERARLRALLATALQRLVAQARDRGAWYEAARLASRWMELVPDDAGATVALVESLWLAGRAEEALARQAALVAHWREELELEPPAALVRLGGEIARTAGVRRPSPTTVSPAGSAALFTPDLVGRDDEFGALTDAWRRVRAGGSATTVISGEAGAGKSRLVEEYVRWAEREARSDALVLPLQVALTSRAAPWTATRALLARLATAPGLLGAPPESLALLGSLSPAIRAAVPATGHAGAATERVPDDAAGLVAVGEALESVRAAVAAEQPVLLAVDDLADADDASLGALLALALRPPAGVHVVLVVADAQPDERLVALRRAPAVRWIALPPLERADVEAMLASMTALDVVDRARLAARLHEQGGGNPLHVVGMVAALADAALLAPDASGRWRLADGAERELPVPATIADALLARLTSLPPPARAVLEAAAVLRTSVPVGPLAAVAGVPDDALATALDELLVRRFLRVSRAPDADSGAELLGFAHELHRRAVYEALNPARRQELHRRAWRALRPLVRGNAALRTELQRHRARAGRFPAARGPHARLAIAALVVASALGGLALATGRERPAARSASTLAVLPFAVHGDSALRYRSEGMVDLLSVALDGAGGLRTVDPHAVLARVRQHAEDERGAMQLAPRAASDLASQLGAGLYVTGSLVEAGGRLELRAALRDSGDVPRATARAVVANEEGLFAATDTLARALLAGAFPGPAWRLTRLAVATTPSLAALRAYLDGEQALRAHAYARAQEAFARAVRADSMFALAHYRLALATEWGSTAEPGTLAAAVARALAHADRLPPRDRAFVEAFAAYHRGAPALAISGYRRALAEYPDDVEGWLALAEVRFHVGPRVGWADALPEARAAYERVRALDPGNVEAALHLARLYARLPAPDERAAALATLRPAVDHPGAVFAIARAVMAFAGDDEAARQAAVAELRHGEDVPALVAADLTSVYASIAGGLELARLVAEPSRPPAVRAAGLVLQAELELARGRWHEARRLLADAGRHHPRLALQYEALLATAPFVPVDTARLAALDAALAARAVETDMAGELPFFTTHEGFEPAVRAYLRGLLAVRRGELRAAERFAVELDARTDTVAGLPLARSLAAGLRARTAAASGDTAAALRALEPLRFETWHQWAIASPFASLAHERFLLAELLRLTGRGGEAMRWYASTEASTPHDLVYLAPSLLRRAELGASLGRPDEAREHYRRFLDVWRDADPAFAPWLERARGRAGALR